MPNIYGDCGGGDKFVVYMCVLNELTAHIHISMLHMQMVTGIEDPQATSYLSNLLANKGEQLCSLCHGYHNNIMLW